MAESVAGAGERLTDFLFIFSPQWQIQLQSTYSELVIN